MPLPVIDFTLMTRDCGCINHEGLHWIHDDLLWFERNLKMLKQGNQHGFLLEEIRRLQEKQMHLKRYVQPGQEYILPVGCNENAYNKRCLEVLEALEHAKS